MAHIVDKFEFVELQVIAGSTGTRYYFPDLPKLRAKKITSIETYTPGVLSYAPSGYVLPNFNSVLSNTYISFYVDGRQDLWRIPWVTLNRTVANTGDDYVRDQAEFRPQTITWDKSYVELAVTPTFATNVSFCLGVYYS